MVQKDTRPQPLTEGQTKGQKPDTSSAPPRPTNPPPPPRPQNSSDNSTQNQGSR